MLRSNVGHFDDINAGDYVYFCAMHALARNRPLFSSATTLPSPYCMTGDAKRPASAGVLKTISPTDITENDEDTPPLTRPASPAQNLE